MATDKYLKKNQEDALKRARSFATQGDYTWAQAWIDRANHFYPVTKRQLDYIQRLFDQQRTDNKFRTREVDENGREVGIAN